MRKFIGCVIAALIAISLISLFIQRQQPKVTAFSLQDYQAYITEFPSDEAVGTVETATDAAKAAEELWLSTFGKDVQAKKPFAVSYDAQAQVWLVHGTLPFYQSGGVPYVLIQEDSGEVLALWHEK